MIKLFTKSVALTTPNTIQRDETSLEDQINDFIREKKIMQDDTKFFVYEVGGVVYYAVLLDYNIKPQ